MNVIFQFGKCRCGNTFSFDDVGKICPYCRGLIVGMSAQPSVQADDGDAAPSQAVSKPDFLSTLAAFFKPTHRR